MHYTIREIITLKQQHNTTTYLHAYLNYPSAIRSSRLPIHYRNSTSRTNSCISSLRTNSCISSSRTNSCISSSRINSCISSSRTNSCISSSRINSCISTIQYSALHNLCNHYSYFNNNYSQLLHSLTYNVKSSNRILIHYLVYKSHKLYLLSSHCSDLTHNNNTTITLTVIYNTSNMHS